MQNFEILKSKLQLLKGTLRNTFEGEIVYTSDDC